MKIESDVPWHYQPPIENFDVEIGNFREHAVPGGPTLIPVESGDLGNDVVFSGFTDCANIREQYKDTIKEGL